jgi:hypothetical protein
MKRLREDGKITPRKREDVGDFRLIVLSSKEPFVISRFLSFGSVFISVPWSSHKIRQDETFVSDSWTPRKINTGKDKG